MRRTNPASEYWFFLAFVLTLWLLGGCTTIKVEAEHVSHPAAGWPVGSKDEEDGLTHVSVFGTLKHEGSCVGYNLKGRDGGGFYGPTVRAGYEWRLK